MWNIKYKKYDKFGFEIKGYDYLNNQFWRFFSIPIARKLAMLKINPIFIATLSFIFGISSCVLFLGFSKSSNLLATLCFSIFWLLDYTDGDLARISSKVSMLGGWVDSIIGKIITPAIYISISANYYNSHKTSLVWILAYTILSCYYVFGMVEKKTSELILKHEGNIGLSHEHKKKNNFKVRGLFRSIAHEVTNGHNTLYLMIIFFGFINRLDLLISFSAFYAIFITFYTLYNSYKTIDKYNKQFKYD